MINSANILISFFLLLLLSSDAFITSPGQLKCLPRSITSHPLNAVVVNTMDSNRTEGAPMNETVAWSSVSAGLTKTNEEAPPRKEAPTLATLGKRLNTKEDRLSLHKISSISFAIASAAIMFGGITSGFQELPEWLVPFDRTLCWSLVTSALTSIPIAEAHREGEKHVKEQFHVMSITLLFQVPLVELYAPWAPGLMNNDALIRPTFQVLLLLQGFGIYEARKAKQELMSAPRATKKNTALGIGFELPEFAKELAFDCVTTMLLPFIGSFFILLLDETKDRSWLLAYANSHGGIPSFYYENVFTSIQLMFGAFFVTLRDKKMVQANVVEAYNLITTLIVVVTAIVILFPAGTFN